MHRLIRVLTVTLMSLGAVMPAAASSQPPLEPGAQAEAALTAGQLDIQLVISGLTKPVGVVNAGDGTQRLFVIEQGGTVRVVANGKLQSGNFLDIRNVSGGFTTGGERGLLGLAFHPNFASNRKLFAYFTNGGGDIVIAEFTTNAARTSASASTYDPILSIEHSARTNHNGGQLLFGPDGYLYIFTGDGGGGGDPDENGQNQATLLGKVLRIAPTLSGGYTTPSNPYPGAVWDIGLRNPWRASFDRGTGSLWIADVGQGTYEEINREPAASGGRNYGWDCREGKHPFESAGCSSGYVDPIAEYTHVNGNCSVTGGYVYRGSIQQDFVGQYVLGDYCSGRIWTIAANGSSLLFHRDTNALITSFGEAENGEIYMTDHAGSLYRVVTSPFSDITSSGFYNEILWLFYEGITGGCGSGRFCPSGSVTREQMASFLARALRLPAATRDYFTDDETSIHEGDINRVAQAGITGGCDANRYCPRLPVTRAQMASFLARALKLPPTSTDYFDDDDGNIHENQINALARSGITGGCGTRAYCPNANVTRGQMAAFLKRALD
ncbi:MAG: PQQ-dependent sugar dehydrogenase [Candidatus Limnocylindria bacterium]